MKVKAGLASWLAGSFNHNKRMLSDWFSAALQTSRKCERYDSTCQK
jgi:hypothetical protein